MSTVETGQELRGPDWVVPIREWAPPRPDVLDCGHTEKQHGKVGCAGVKRIEADTAAVRRREQRWEHWKTGPVRWLRGLRRR